MFKSELDVDKGFTRLMIFIFMNKKKKKKNKVQRKSYTYIDIVIDYLLDALNYLSNVYVNERELSN